MFVSVDWKAIKTTLRICCIEIVSQGAEEAIVLLDGEGHRLQNQSFFSFEAWLRLLLKIPVWLQTLQWTLNIFWGCVCVCVSGSIWDVFRDTLKSLTLKKPSTNSDWLQAFACRSVRYSESVWEEGVKQRECEFVFLCIWKEWVLIGNDTSKLYHCAGKEVHLQWWDRFHLLCLPW